MNYIKNVGDNQNKFGDTATVFQLGLMKDDEVYNFGDNQVTVNIANETGYVLSVTPDKSSQNTVLNLDFNKVPLRNLTPDSYRLEVEVKSTDGDIAKFPTSGAMTFSINHDLKETSGELVPTVTFDTVLAAVDEKIAVYMDTVKVGPQGPVGPAGSVDASQDNTFTGVNTFTQRIQGAIATRLANFTDLATVAADMYSYQGNWWFGSGQLLNSPVSSYAVVEVFHGSTKTTGYIRITSSISGDSYYANVNNGLQTWNKYAKDATVVHNTGTGTVAGDKTFTGNTTFTQAINGFFGQRTLPITDLNLLNNKTYNGLWGIDGSSVLNSPETNAGLLTNSVLNSSATIQKITMLTGPNKSRTYERVYSGTWTNWSLLPVDGQLVHNAGTETVAGDKTLTGVTRITNNTTITSGVYGLRVTTTGIQKTSDNGATWTNI